MGRGSQLRLDSRGAHRSGKEKGKAPRRQFGQTGGRHFGVGQMDQLQPSPVDRAHAESTAASADVRLSYKFQRLREKLRAAIASGELSGKLPGERQLARRFRVNAKTLSKALTDLAAEGLLERSIGRGTFVKGSLPEGDPATTAAQA